MEKENEIRQNHDLESAMSLASMENPSGPREDRDIGKLLLVNEPLPRSIPPLLHNKRRPNKEINSDPEVNLAPLDLHRSITSTEKARKRKRQSEPGARERKPGKKSAFEEGVEYKIVYSALEKKPAYNDAFKTNIVAHHSLGCVALLRESGGTKGLRVYRVC